MSRRLRLTRNVIMSICNRRTTLSCNAVVLSLATLSKLLTYLGRISQCFSCEKSSVGRGSDKRTIESIHLVVESARVAQIVSGSVAAPQRGRHRSTVHTLLSTATDYFHRACAARPILHHVCRTINAKLPTTTNKYRYKVAREHTEDHSVLLSCSTFN